MTDQETELPGMVIPTYFRPIEGRTDICDLVDEQGNYLRTVTAEELTKHIRKEFHG